MKFSIKQGLLALFILTVIAAVIYGVHYAVSPLSTVGVSEVTVENSVSCKTAYIVRDESLFLSEFGGTVYHRVAEGDRIAKDTLVSTIFPGEISADSLKELKTIDKKIHDYEDRMLKNTESYSVDENDVENTVNTLLDTVVSLREANDAAGAAELRSRINSIRRGVSVSEEDELEILKEQLSVAENGISSERKDIISDISGIFTTYTDGAETLLTPEDIPSYTPSYLKNLRLSRAAARGAGNLVDAGDPVCKIVNNHVWYLLAILPSSWASECETDKSVSVKFSDVAEETQKATIYSVSEAEGDEVVVCLKCTDYFEDALSYRTASAEIVFDSYTGIEIPASAIHTADDGKQYVIALRRNAQYECECEVVYTDANENMALVCSAQDAKNKIESMDTVVTGER